MCIRDSGEAFGSVAERDFAQGHRVADVGRLFLERGEVAERYRQRHEHRLRKPQLRKRCAKPVDGRVGDEKRAHHEAEVYLAREREADGEHGLSLIHISESAAWLKASFSGSMLAVASSKTTMGASLRRARAMEMRCF